MSDSFPRKLSTNKASPHYNMEAARMVDKVFVDGVHVENCVAYDKDMGWAFGIKDGIWQPKVYGKVTVKLKGQDNE